MDDDWVLVIGAAGGIGQSICYQEETDGSNVVGLDKMRPLNSMHFIEQKIGQETRIIPWNLNYGDINRIYITIGQPSSREFEHTVLSKEIQVMWDNFHVVTQAIRAVLEMNCLDGEASFVLTSSVSAQRADRGGAIYAAAKAALEALVRNLARELMPYRINAIAPGPTSTQQYMENTNHDTRYHDMNRSPFNQLITPNQVARAAVDLAKMEGVSGTILPVDLAGLSSSRG